MSETTTDSDNTGGYISAATALLGAWLIVGVFVFSPMPDANFWNDIIVGGAIGTIAGYNAIQSDDRGINTGAASLVALLGLWMVIAPFVFETTGAASFWSDVLTGALVAVLAGYNAYRSRETDRRATTAEAETP
ncbi:SPW repeat protein [Halorussus lipolyticus]|uniref:SPW repeat protein n=1 Tax=Halorussus lipolyticus TaxID=3034024 RepID=UPI0023E8DEEE|nr:SPW repeat protein [Halorussus sp. DT80]